jgi:hypothetical protein
MPIDGFGYASNYIILARYISHPPAVLTPGLSTTKLKPVENKIDSS